MQIIQYLHAAILVSDLEQAEQFYSTVLGLQKVDRPFSYAGIWYQVGTVQLHLIVDKTLNLTLANGEKLGRNPHLALGVANLETAKAHLLAHDCAVQISASGRAALFTQDPDGNVIELTQV